MVVRLLHLGGAILVALGVAASGAAADPELEIRAAIYSVRPDGTGRRLIARPDVPGGSLVRSPDQKRILFGRLEGANYSLYVAGLSGANPVRITPASGRYLGARFSPDGTKVAFSSSIDCGYRCFSGSLYVVNVDGSGLHRVAENGAGPSWSPGGRRIAYSDNGVIHVVNVAGGGDTVVAGGALHVWAPRGERIAYVRTRKGYGVPCFVNADGSRPTCLRGFSAIGPLVWSPDGKRLAFKREPLRRLVTLRADGRSLRPISGRARYVHALAWSPDGRRIVHSVGPPWGRSIMVRSALRLGAPTRVARESRKGMIGDVRWRAGSISYVVYEEFG